MFYLGNDLSAVGFNSRRCKIDDQNLGRFGSVIPNICQRLASVISQDLVVFTILQTSELRLTDTSGIQTLKSSSFVV